MYGRSDGDSSMWSIVVLDIGPTYVGKLLGMIWRPCWSMKSFSMAVLVFGANTLALKSPCMHTTSSSSIPATKSLSMLYACCFSAEGFDTSNMYTLNTCSRLYLFVNVIHVTRSVSVSCCTVLHCVLNALLTYMPVPRRACSRASSLPLSACMLL